MIYLGNGMWSDSGPNLSHGGPWRDHKYIKIVNGRYIYPGDGGSRKSEDRMGNDQKYDTPRVRIGSNRKNPYGYNMTFIPGVGFHPKDVMYKGPGVESISSPVDFKKKQDEINKIEETQDKNGTKVSVTKYAKRPDGNNPRDPMGLGGNHKFGNMGNGKKGRGAKTTGSDQRLNSNKKYQKAVSSQGPSQAELAQRGMMKGSSKNVSTGSKTVQYQKQLTDSNKKYQKAVSSQGPSAAELAQREKGSKKKPKSKNVNSGKPNKKKKNPFKELAKWIKGSEGKVSVKK